MSATEGRQGHGPTNVRAYKSIQLWMDVVNRMYHLSEEEWRGRLHVVQEFCKFEGKDPDEIIAEARGDRAEKIDYMRRLKRFVDADSQSHCGPRLREHHPQLLHQQWRAGGDQALSGRL